MQRFKVVGVESGCIHGLDVGLPVKSLEAGGWIGTTGEPNRSYTFWVKGLFYGQFRLPATLSLFDVIHVGQKGDTVVDRKKWVVEDFDEKLLILSEWKDKDDE